MIETFVHALFWLLAGHALCDFPLQGEFLSRAKRRDLKEGAHGFWFFALSAHALIHAAAVGLITGSIILAMIEFVAHWSIDKLKCEGAISMVADQVMHVACKVAIAALVCLSPAPMLGCLP